MSILEFLKFEPSDDQKRIIERLKDKDATQTMRVVGRGTLTKSAKAVRSSPEAKKFIESAKELVG